MALTVPPSDPFAVLDRLPVSVFQLDRDFHILYGNRFVCEQMHTTRHEVIGKACPDLGMPDDVWRGWKAVVAESFDTGRPGQYEFLSDKGLERLVEFRVAPELAADDRVASVWVIALTINEVNRLRRKLRESEELFRAFLDRAPAIAWLRDDSGRYTFLNHTYLSHYGLRAEDRIGKTVDDVWPADTARQFRANDRAVMASGRDVRVLETAPEPGGGERHWLNVKFPFVGQDGTRYVGGIGVDVTEQRAADERAAATARLESLGLLAAGAAHDFNNLLTAMVGHASLAEAKLPAGSPAAAHLRDIQDAGMRAAELCHQMLAFAGRRGSQPRPTDLVEVVRETARLTRSVLPRSAALVLDLPADPQVVRADPTNLRQVVLNLLTNAGDAMTGRAGSIRAAVGRVGDRVVLTVSDDGCGMSAEVAARVFDPFYTTKPHGRGLGLAAVQGIVRTLGGEVAVESVEGVGSTFRVSLPPDLPPA